MGSWPLILSWTIPSSACRFGLFLAMILKLPSTLALTHGKRVSLLVLAECVAVNLPGGKGIKGCQQTIAQDKNFSGRVFLFAYGSASEVTLRQYFGFNQLPEENFNRDLLRQRIQVMFICDIPPKNNIPIDPVYHSQCHLFISGHQCKRCAFFLLFPTEHNQVFQSSWVFYCILIHWFPP